MQSTVQFTVPFGFLEQMLWHVSNVDGTSRDVLWRDLPACKPGWICMVGNLLTDLRKSMGMLASKRCTMPQHSTAWQLLCSVYQQLISSSCCHAGCNSEDLMCIRTSRTPPILVGATEVFQISLIMCWLCNSAGLGFLSRGGKILVAY